MDSFARLYDITSATKITRATVMLDKILDVDFNTSSNVYVYDNTNKSGDTCGSIYSNTPELSKCCEKVILRPNKHLKGKWSIVYENSELNIYCNAMYDIPIKKAGKFKYHVIDESGAYGESVSERLRDEKINEVCIIPNSLDLDFRKEFDMNAEGRLILRLDAPVALHLVFPPHPVKKEPSCINQ